jgi:FlaA1/EpsC-like NDP-sugar epimerase
MNYLVKNLIGLKRLTKQIILVVADSVTLIIVLLMSFSIRLDQFYWPNSDLFWVIIGVPIIAIPTFISFDLYRTVIRFIGFKSLWSVFQAVTLYALLWGLIGFMASLEGIPRSVILINWVLSLIAISGLRMFALWLLSDQNLNDIQIKNVVIYGAGSAGRQLSSVLKNSLEYNPIAFIDDNFELQKQYINGLKIVSRDNLGYLVKSKDIKEILIAMPLLSRSKLNEIFSFLQPYPVLVRSLPSVIDLAKGKLKVEDLKKISINDLLGRKPVSPNNDLLSRNIKNKAVLVTGAGGSIGSELCRQIIKIKPKILILYEQSEYALYKIDKELRNNMSPSIDVLPMLGSINNKKRLIKIFKLYEVNTIYHAAAYKHVPIVEFNNAEGVNNNIFGTLNCALAAIDSLVETFVFISTDKAVRPTNLMGATKRFSEMILQAFSKNSQLTSLTENTPISDLNESKGFKTCFSIVRFGNVLNSSGSVIPLFKEQIKKGGPVTVTDKEIIRYFMTIPESVELVIQAGAMGTGGDVFVLDMGKPIRIFDLATKMINLSGLKVRDKNNPDGDIEIEVTGLRPGEKLFEELLIGKNVSTTDHPMIMKEKEEYQSWESLEISINELKEALDGRNNKSIRDLVMETVTDFKPQSQNRDLLE